MAEMAYHVQHYQEVPHFTSWDFHTLAISLHYRDFFPLNNHIGFVFFYKFLESLRVLNI